ncbi:MAG: NAD(P)-dependent oxidoreductase [Acidilobus sp.]|nr:NAD(P)-dependent oxidoreductase [Acidilobus sp.]MCG2890414.1 NAD(P)-dependent oxidoreductase [Acidilobus sp.]MCG2891035.1 NAD(P)-dependent oxidoreductase [Acidilobus sp.]
MTKVFVIGLGRMGRGIVKNLVKKGYSVLGYDVSPRSYELLAGITGFRPAVLPEAREADYVLLTLPTARELLGVLDEITGSKGVIINMTTVGLDDAKAAASKAASMNLRYLTAMMEGGPANAETGTLTLYVGGPVEVYNSSLAFLRDVGNPIYVGSHEAATAIKLLSTAILLANTAILAEASQALLRLGLEPDLLVKALSSGGADSAQLRSRLPMMLSGLYKDVFSVDLGVYVLEEAIKAARALGSNYTPLLSHVVELLRAARGLGLGSHDVAEVAEVYKYLTSRKG